MKPFRMFGEAECKIMKSTRTMKTPSLFFARACVIDMRSQIAAVAIVMARPSRSRSNIVKQVDA
eukprot:15475363-Alexandrium_andersonii.AAC.1